jgi:formate/nitrite transporter FocA (FNT family)
MTLGLVAMGAFSANLPDTPSRPLIVCLGYPLGYLIVILGRQQLFTENTLTPLLPILARPTPARIARLGALWGIVLAFNVIGALIGATSGASRGASTLRFSFRPYSETSWAASRSWP